MSIYYFIKRRFPRREKRVELRSIFDVEGHIPEKVLHDDQYFEDFNLRLTEKLPNRTNKFNGLNYSTLGDHRTQLDLRPIRNIVVKQNGPGDDDSAIYEVFNRLNTGGINLRPQEIRTSMYHSRFYDMLYRLNQDPRWRRIIQSEVPDIHMKDIEILLRGFAMLINSSQYAPSMVRFLNHFSRMSAANEESKNKYLSELFSSFLDATKDLADDAFINSKSNRFNIALFEAVFTAACETSFAERRTLRGTLPVEAVTALELDPEFMSASLEGTTSRANVDKRLLRARQIVPSL
jgi:hypothetical protein